MERFRIVVLPRTPYFKVGFFFELFARAKKKPVLASVALEIKPNIEIGGAGSVPS